MTRADASTVLAFVPAPARYTAGGCHRCPCANEQTALQCSRATRNRHVVCYSHAKLAARRAALAKGGAL